MNELAWYFAGLLTPAAAYALFALAVLAVVPSSTTEAWCGYCKSYRIHPKESRWPMWVEPLVWAWHKRTAEHRRNARVIPPGATNRGQS